MKTRQALPTGLLASVLFAFAFQITASPIAWADNETTPSSLARALEAPVNIEFDGADLSKILSALEEYTRVQIDRKCITGPNAKPLPVPYVKLVDVPMRDALQAVLRPHNLTYRVVDDCVEILPSKTSDDRQPSDSGWLFKPSASELETRLDGRISISFEKCHITKAIDELARASGANIVVDARVVAPAGSVSSKSRDSKFVTDGMIAPIEFKSKPVRDILNILLEPLHLRYSVVSNFVWISTQKRIDTESFDDLETRTYQILIERDEMTRLLDEGILYCLPNVYEPDTEEAMTWLIYNPKINQVMIRNSPKNIAVAEALMRRLGMIPPQVEGQQAI